MYSRNKLVNILGVVLTACMLGMITGGSALFIGDEIEKMQEKVMGISIPPGIPLILFSNNIN